MSPLQIMRFWRIQGAAAEAIGVSQPTIASWVKSGKIPDIQQLRIQVITHGRLKADKDVLKKYTRV